MGGTPGKHQHHQHDMYRHASLGAPAPAFCVNYTAVRQSCFTLCESPSAENWRITALKTMRRHCVKRAIIAVTLRVLEGKTSLYILRVCVKILNGWLPVGWSYDVFCLCGHDKCIQNFIYVCKVWNIPLGTCHTHTQWNCNFHQIPHIYWVRWVVGYVQVIKCVVKREKNNN